MKFYLEQVEDVLKEVNSSIQGLSSQEAKKRQEENGKNILETEKKEGLIKKIFKSIYDPMIILLIITAIISGIASKIIGESLTDVFIILFVVVINTVMSLIQESKAEKAIDALKKMTAATSKVIRNGNLEIIKSEDLVVGDILVIEAGDVLSADCRIIESHSLKAEEAALTGESTSISKMIDALNLKNGDKDIVLGDRKNMLYSGSTISYGRGKAVVTAIGMNTEIGKIAQSLNEAKDKKTPLQIKMGELSKTLTKVVVAISVLVFIMGLIRHGSINILIVIDTMLTAVALAVAAIPEGLPAVVTIILSIGVTAMAKRKALIRKLNAVETLGCTQIICTDKTGTLTQNKMTVVDFYAEDEKLLAKAMALCSDSTLEQGEEYAKGEPTENGLVEYANKLGFPKYKLDEQYKRIGEVPFDSGRKLMSTIHKEEDQIIQYTKGACEILINKCVSYIKDGKVVPLTDEVKNEIKSKNKEFADRALRVLGVAYKNYEENPPEHTAEKLENNLIFIGFVGMIDPCRQEVFRSNRKLQNCKYKNNNDNRRP